MFAGSPHPNLSSRNVNQAKGVPAILCSQPAWFFRRSEARKPRVVFRRGCPHEEKVQEAARLSGRSLPAPPGYRPSPKPTPQLISGSDSVSAELGLDGRTVLVAPASRRLIFRCMPIKTCRRDAGATANARPFVANRKVRHRLTSGFVACRADLRYIIRQIYEASIRRRSAQGNTLSFRWDSFAGQARFTGNPLPGGATKLRRSAAGQSSFFLPGAPKALPRCDGTGFGQRRTTRIFAGIGYEDEHPSDQSESSGERGA